MNELEEYFRKLRFDKNFHLGLGDVRLTMAMQEEVIAIAKRVASQQSVERTRSKRGRKASKVGIVKLINLPE